MSDSVRLLRSHTLPRYLARARAAGRDISKLLADAKLPANADELPEIEVELAHFRQLTDSLADAIGDSHLGLNLAKAMPPSAFGVVELAARSTPTFREGGQRLVRYVGLLNDFELFGLEEHGPEASIVHRVPGEPLALGRHGNEQLLGFMVRVIREMLQKPWHPSRVSLAHAAPSDVAPLRAFFETDALQFGVGHNALHFDAATLQWPVATHNAPLLEMLDQQAHRALGTNTGPGDELSRVRERIRVELQDGPPSLERVAGGLKMSPRTLQRRLAELELSFSEVVEETRRDLAQDYLARSQLALAEIAFLLGYSDLTTFIRAFKRWTGLTPKAYRDQHAE